MGEGKIRVMERRRTTEYLAEHQVVEMAQDSLVIAKSNTEFLNSLLLIRK